MCIALTARVIVWGSVLAWLACGAALAQQDGREMGETERATILAGIDVLGADGFAAVKGLRLGLLTHAAGRDRAGRRTIDVLAKAEGVRLVTLFSPEHGLAADREGNIGAGSDAATGLPILSLYGADKRPSAAMLQGLDAIVIDLQDVGVRFYTYATTMAYVLEEAAKARIKVIVLDRPNPILPAGVAGPTLDKDLLSFVGYFPMPVQHGMTLGELARMFNAVNAIGADLAVVPVRGYRRDQWYEDTGLPWVAPSPNLKRLGATVLYPGIGMLEFTNVSVGRGTPTPFEVLGAPWIDGAALAKRLQRRAIPGVRVRAASFTPRASTFARERCQGIRIEVVDRARVDSVRLGIEIAAALRALHGETYEDKDLLKLVGSKATLAALRAGKDPAAIAAGWRKDVEAFQALRAPHLLY